MMDDIFNMISDEFKFDVENIKPEDLISNGHIYVPKYMWAALNTRFSESEIKLLLNRAVEENNIPFPYPDISDDVAWQSYEDLKNIDSYEQFSFQEWSCKKIRSSKWNTPFYDGKSVLLKRNYKGLNASGKFHLIPRMDCSHVKNPSPRNKWKKRKSRNSMWGALWTLKMTHLNKSTCYSLIKNRGYIASQFRPASAKAIYDAFNADRVLDFSAGWGDRLAGFYASNATEYVGIDPNTSLQGGYSSQVKFYGGHKKTKFICQPAEDVDYSEYKEYFDLCFTSPPYFIVEKYSQESSQSWVRYGKDTEAWLNKFLFTTIQKAWESLKPNGRMVINIADVLYSFHDYLEICHPLNEFMSTLPDAHFEGVIGYELAQRMGANQKDSNLDKNSFHKDKKPAEPMWVWSKGKQDAVSFTPKEFWEF